MKTVRSTSVFDAFQQALEQIPAEKRVNYIMDPGLKYLVSPEVYQAFLISPAMTDRDDEYFEVLKKAVTEVKYAGVSVELDPHLEPGKAVLVGPDVTIGITLEPPHEN